MCRLPISLPESKKRETRSLNHLRSKEACPQVQVHKLSNTNSLHEESAGAENDVLCPEPTPSHRNPWRPTIIYKSHLLSCRRELPFTPRQLCLEKDARCTTGLSLNSWYKPRRGPARCLAIPLSGPLPCPLPYMTILEPFPQTSHTLIFSLLLCF